QAGHDRGEGGQRAGAQVVAVGEATGQHYSVHSGQGVAGVPQPHRFGAGQPHGAGGVPVVQAAGEGDHTDAAHQRASAGSAVPACSAQCTETTSSITGLESTSSATLRALARASSVAGPSISSSNRLPWRTPVKPVKPRRGSAPATALPCGSRISGL